MNRQVFVNHFSTTLAADINSTVTALQLTSATGAPTIANGDWWLLHLVDTTGAKEIVKVTARTGVNCTIVRAQEGTTNVAHTLTPVTIISGRLTAATLEDFEDAKVLVSDILRLGRSQFAYVGTAQLSIAGGGYFHEGTTDQALLINSTITHTITSPGTSQWQYIYADDSAIVSAGTNILTGSEIINSTTEPTYNVAKRGWYNGTDLCLFAVYIDGSGNIDNFYHDGGDLVVWDEQPQSIGALTPSTTWTDVDMSDEAPAFCTKILATFSFSYVDGSNPVIEYRSNGSSGGGQRVALVNASETRAYPQRTIFSDSAQVIEVRFDTATANSAIEVYGDGWFLPKGM